MKKKSFWSRLSLIVFIVCSFAVSATALQYEYFTYYEIGATITITGYTGSGGAVTIPSTIDDKPVTRIDENAFSSCTSLTSVTIPDGVIRILNSAFKNCTSLTSVMIGNSVTVIESDAFNGCTRLTSATIGSNVLSIGDSAFFGCTSLTKIYFKGNAPFLDGGWVFSGDNNATVYYLPDTKDWASTFGGRPTVLWADPSITGLNPAHGSPSGGTSVVITGGNLATVTKVMFGTVAATLFTVNSPTQITAVAPKGIADQTVDVSVTSPNGTFTDTDADDYVYDSISLPTITWGNPEAIVYGTPLSTVQLNAKANVSGWFVYAHAIGSKLTAGAHDLTVTFFPTDTVQYASTQKTVSLTVNKAVATVTITGLKQVYDGQSRTVTATTLPAGMAVNFAYVPDAPVNAGSYAVTATVVNDNYTGVKAGTLVIAKANQTINFTPPVNLRFGDADFALAATASSGLVPVTYTSSNPLLASITGDGKLHIVGIGTTTITASRPGDTNWNAAPAVKKAVTIGKKIQEIAFDAFSSHAMGDPDISPGATATSTLPVTYSSAKPAVAKIVGGNIRIVGKGSAVITATQPGNAIWSAATPVKQTLTVDKGNQTISFPPLPGKVYCSADFAPGASASSGLAVTYASLDPKVATIVNGKIHITGVGTTTITARQLGNVNWNPSSDPPQEQALTVGQGTPVITWANPAAILYGKTLCSTQLRARANVPGKFVYLPVIGSKLIVGTHDLTVTFTPTDTVRYTGATKTVSLTVNKATATISIAGLSQKFNGSPRPVTVTTVPAGLHVDTTYNGSSDAPTAIGSYTVVSTVNDINANPATKTGKLVIAKGVQTISFPALPVHSMGDADFAPATATSGLPVTYASAKPAVAIIVNGKIHLVGVGSTAITATQAGNANWNPAPAVTKTLTVSKGNQTIVFPSLSGKSYGDADFAPGATTLSGLPVSYASSVTAVATIVNGNIHITGVGTTTITATQPGNANWNAASSVQQTLTVETWSVTQNGDIFEIAYGEGINFTQYGALHLDSSYFRLNCGVDSVWGTSAILLPSFWSGGILYQGAPITPTWVTDGPNLVISFTGSISDLDVKGEVRISPPANESISARVSVNVNGNVVLDNRPDEAFKPAMLSSMHISSESWDARSAFAGLQTYPIPESGWLISPAVNGVSFGLDGGTSSWKINAPTVEITLDEPMQITGWVTASDDPNDDNVGFWAATDTVLPSWSYIITSSAAQ